MATASAAAAGPDGGEAPASHRSYLRHRDALYLKVSAGLCAAAIVAYALYVPPHGRGGGTAVGYTLGTLAAGLMIWLAWFGVRKRKFRDGSGNARAWLSAHVYLGLALVVLVTLHSAFRFGWNLHTFAYGLVWLVALSGLYGVWAYARLPERITANRQQVSPATMVEEIGQLEATALRLADKVDAETHQVVTRSVSRLKIGGSVWQQITGNYPRSRDARSALAELAKKKAAPPAQGARPAPAPDDDRDVTVHIVADKLFEAGRGDRASEKMMKTGAFMADKLAKEGKADRSENLKKILEVLGRRRELVERLNRDITLRARLSVWLYLHVPLTVTLVAAVIAHVLAVFLYH